MSEKNRAFEMRATQISATEIGVVKRRSREDSYAKVSLGEAHVSEVHAAQDCTPEIGIC